MLRHVACAVSVLFLPAALLAQPPAVRPGQTPPPSTASPAIATATIRGRVVAADTGRPLRGARVQLTAPELSAPRTFVTDVNGRYEASGLSAGRYTVTASAASFVSLSYGQTRPFETGRPIVLAVRQMLDDVNLRLPRGGAIAGQVLNESGRPLIGADVTALRPRFERGIRQLVRVAFTKTNDLGEFRISGLSPGAFIVWAAKGFPVGSEAILDTETGYGRTFFPGTRNAAEARPIAVRLGQTSSGISFVLDVAGTGSIAGRLLESDGRGVLPFVRVRRLGDEAADLSSGTSGNGSTGAFTVAALPPGEYELSMAFPATQGRGANAGLGPRAASARVVLNGDNLTGVRLVLEPMPVAFGRIVFDPLTTARPPASAIRLSTLPADPSEAQSYPTAITPAGDLTFTLSAPPGRRILRSALPKGWALKQVRLNGKDVTDTGVEFRTGQETDIEVELTDRVTTVSGSVRGEKGERMNDYTVLLFARDQDRWTGDRFFALARPDQNGTFEASALPPGDYHAAALAYVVPDEAQDPALLDRLQRDAFAFTLGEGESKTLDLRVMQ